MEMGGRGDQGPKSNGDFVELLGGGPRLEIASGNASPERGLTATNVGRRP